MGYIWSSNPILNKPTLSTFEERERRHTMSTVTFTDVSPAHSTSTDWARCVPDTMHCGMFSSSSGLYPPDSIAPAHLKL